MSDLMEEGADELDIKPECGCVVLEYQPIAVLVEIDDPEYKKL